MAEDTINVREPDPQLSQQDSAPKAEKKVQPEQAQKIDDEMDQRVKDFHRRFDDLVNDAAAGKKGLFSSPDRNAKRLQEDLAKLIKDIQNRQAKDAEESRKAVEAREQLLKKKAKADDFFKTEKAKIDAIAMEMQTKIQKMYDDLDKRRTEVLQAPDEDKKGLIDRFSGWMKNIYRNNVNELRKILGLPVKDEKKEQEAQKTAAETVVNQQSQPQTQTQAQTGQDSKSLEKIIATLEKQLAEQKELYADLQKRFDDQTEKITELETKLGQKTADQVRDNAAPQQKSAPEPQKKPEQKSPEPQKKGPETVAKPGDEWKSTKRDLNNRISPVTGEPMNVQVWADEDTRKTWTYNQKLVFSSGYLVSPEDFTRAYISHALIMSHHSDLSRIIKNAAETFSLALDKGAVAAPCETASGESVYAFSSLNFNFKRIYDAPEKQKEIKDKLGLSDDELKDFIHTAERVENTIHGEYLSDSRYIKVMDVDEYRKVVQAAAKKEIAAKGLDEKEFDKLLDEARKAPVQTALAHITDRMGSKEGDAILDKDGSVHSWQERKNTWQGKLREQELKDKGSKTQAGSVRG